MQYPQLSEVETADRLQLARWMRHLDSPGLAAVQSEDFPEVVDREAAILKRISERFRELGGWSVEVSKAVGWEREEAECFTA